MMVPYFDPLQDQLGALERSIEFSFEIGDVFYEHPDEFMNDVARTLAAVERSIEGTEIPGPAPIEWDTLAPPPSSVVVLGYASEGPPPPPESNERPWITLEPPAAARPYFTPDGPPRPLLSWRGHIGAGVRHSDSSASSVWCQDRREFIDEDVCRDCDQWGDYGSGFEECYFDWTERGENRKEDDEHGQEE